MKIITLIIVATLLFASSSAQSFHIADEISSGENISIKENLSDIPFRIDNNIIYQIRQINKHDGRYDLKITSISIDHEGVLRSDTITNIPSSFKIKDFCVRKQRIMITANEKFLLCDMSVQVNTIYMHPDSLQPKNDTHPFKYCAFLNDSIVLLYTIYDYHPADGPAGVYLKTFNVKTKQFDKLKFMKFPGIAISHLSSNWIAVLGGYIYMVSPLSGTLYQLDQDLNLIDKYDMHIFQGQQLTDNLTFEAYTDSIINFEASRILTIVSKYPKDSIMYHRAEFGSNIYTKDFFAKNIDIIMSKNSFVNQIYSKDDSFIVLSISNPGSNMKYADLLFYDPLKRKIIRSYKHFPCVHPDSLSSPEDLFAINFAADKIAAPQFYEGYVYSSSLFGMSSFELGKYEDVSFRLFSASKSTGYSWNVHKCQLH